MLQSSCKTTNVGQWKPIFLTTVLNTAYLWWVELSSKFNDQSFEAKNRESEFDYQKMNTFESVRCSKNDVRVCLMNDLENLVKAF